MTYEVEFLQDGKVLDRFSFEASTPHAFKQELARIRSAFQQRRPGAKQIMSVTAPHPADATLPNKPNPEIAR